MNLDYPSLIAATRARVKAAFTPPPSRHDDMVVNWHPMVLAAGANDALAQQLLDAVHAAEPALLAGKRITVVCPALSDGAGDLALAWRVCTTLSRHAPSARISLVVPDSDIAAPLTDVMGPVHVVDVSEGFAALPHCDLFIITPDPSAARYSSAAMQAFVDEGARRYPSLVVSEYGGGAAQSTRWRVLPTGLGPFSAGIFVDPYLSQAAVAYRAKPAAARLESLHAWSSRALPMLAHRPWRGLHLVYVREPEAVRPAVARALSTWETDPNDLLVVVLRHALAADDVGQWRASGLPVTQAPSEGLVCVTSVATLPPALFRDGLLHADAAVVTGDQSLGEAIAAQAPFAYEARTHKQTLVHRLQEIASRFGPELHAAMAPLDARVPPPRAPRAAWDSMFLHMRENCDATQRLVGRASRVLHATQANHVLEDAVVEACAAAGAGPGPSADARLVQSLQKLAQAVHLS